MKFNLRQFKLPENLKGEVFVEASRILERIKNEADETDVWEVDFNKPIEITKENVLGMLMELETVWKTINWSSHAEEIEGCDALRVETEVDELKRKIINSRNFWDWMESGGYADNRYIYDDRSENKCTIKKHDEVILIRHMLAYLREKNQNIPNDWKQIKSAIECLEV